MKIAVLNFSGNVGKSVVSKHLLLPRIPGAKLFTVESINAGEGGEAFRGDDFGKLQKDLMLLDAAVVDVGASNVEAFVELMSQYRGSHEDFDLFVVPTIKAKKQTADTVATVEYLRLLGVGPDRIRVVFNMVGHNEHVDETFADVFDYHAVHKSFPLRPDAAIATTELFQQLGDTTIAELLADETDWRAAMRAATTIEEKTRIADLVAARRLAMSAKDNLDAVFSAVVKPGKK